MIHYSVTFMKPPDPLFKECFPTHTMPNVPQQDGIKDCGPFAVAFATILASEGNSETLLTSIRFDQDKLRAHLCACLENQNITSFSIVHTGGI